jgi:hypothetical protein
MEIHISNWIHKFQKRTGLDAKANLKLYKSNRVCSVLEPNSHDCTLALILESGWLRTSLSMPGFRYKQCTLFNTVLVSGDGGSSPGKSRGAMPKYDPTTKLIILRRSPKTLLWNSCGLNLHTNTVYRKK